MFERTQDAPRVWAVGALCQAVAQALDGRFNPIRVTGEITGFSQAASGHCYFSLKDVNGQLRCAMFRRAASQLRQLPRDGDRVEAGGRLGVYEARGELQLVVETLTHAGQGNLFEEFLLRKQRLEREGLFAAERKRPVAPMPRAVGIVTSLGAAALHDVLTALARRVPHVAVVIAPAAVQGAQAPAELVAALEALYNGIADNAFPVPLDTLLLVRGGGAIEDLWAFNDEALARAIAASPVPVIAGIGHETDFTIADFVADLRAPTPTAAAEMVSVPRAVALAATDTMAERLRGAAQRYTDRHAQHVDRLGARFGRQSGVVAREDGRLAQMADALRHAMRIQCAATAAQCDRQSDALPVKVAQALRTAQQRLHTLDVKLQTLDPRLVLQRGYAMLTRADGAPLTRISQVDAGQAVRAHLVDGVADLTAVSTHHN